MEEGTHEHRDVPHFVKSKYAFKQNGAFGGINHCTDSVGQRTREQKEPLIRCERRNHIANPDDYRPSHQNKNARIKDPVLQKRG